MKPYSLDGSETRRQMGQCEQMLIAEAIGVVAGLVIVAVIGLIRLRKE
jgi:hypothetical protein